MKLVAWFIFFSCPSLPSAMMLMSEFPLVSSYGLFGWSDLMKQCQLNLQSALPLQTQFKVQTWECYIYIYIYI